MDSLRFAVAVGPLAVYLALLAIVNLRRRPLLTTGTRDTSLLAFALVGFVVVGPMELFMPQAAAVRFGPYVWLLLVGFYALCITLYLLLCRPRLVVYNISVGQLRPVLSTAVDAIDGEARWAGDSLVLPNLGVQLHLEYFTPLRNVTLRATRPQQSLAGWKTLEEAVAQALRNVEVPTNPRGYSLLIASLLMAGGVLYTLASTPPKTVQHELYRMMQVPPDEPEA